MSTPPLDTRLLEAFLQPMLQSLQVAVTAGGSPLIALNGPVGAGKSSLCSYLLKQARHWGFRLAVASIDDFYLPWEQRLKAMAGNPFGVNRVPPGSHDVALLQERLGIWRGGGPLELPRFDKSRRGGDGDRLPAIDLPAQVLPEERAQALILEGWLMGCRPLGALALAELGDLEGSIPAPGLAGLSPAEAAWLPRWDRELACYGPLFDSCDALWLLRPEQWSSVRRWRFQAEARQRRRGGAWLAPRALDALVRSSLACLPPALYQDPLLSTAKASAHLDGRRRCVRVTGFGEAQLSLSSASSSMG